MRGLASHAGRRPKALGNRLRSGRRTAGGRRKALTMPRIARGFPPTRRIACPISMGHYQRSLVLALKAFERLARYEVHLDRKLERTLFMLFRLKELRSTTDPA